jgi:hypothetical protein
VLCFYAWFLRTGENPFAVRNAWVLPATLVALSMVVPLLRSRWFVLSLPMQLIFSLLIAHGFDRPGRRSHLARVAVALGSLAALFVISLGTSRWLGAGMADYSHVFDLLIAKVGTLGVLPEDPAGIPFGARLLWQGPFRTIEPQQLYYELVAGLVLIGVAVAGVPLVALAKRQRVGWLRRDDPGFALVCLFSVAGLATALLIQRNVVLPGLVTPVLGAVMLSRIRPAALGSLLMCVGILWQAQFFGGLLKRHSIVWYTPAARNAEITNLVHWLRAHTEEVPTQEPIVSDIINSTAILAHTRHPIVLQPKYETREARRRVAEFVDTVIWGDLDDVRRYLQRYRARYLLIDRVTVWRGFGYIAGVPRGGQPLERSAIRSFLSDDPEVLGNLPGYRLLYRSDPSSGYDHFRLYEVEPLE